MDPSVVGMNGGEVQGAVRCTSARPLNGEAAQSGSALPLPPSIPAVRRLQLRHVELHHVHHRFHGAA